MNNKSARTFPTAKKLLCAALALLLCAALASCGDSGDANSAPDGMKLLEGASSSYSVYVPQSWIADSSTGFVSAYVSEADSSNVSFMAFALSGDDTLVEDDPASTIQSADDYWQYYEKDFTTLFTDIRYETYALPETDAPEDTAADTSSDTSNGVSESAEADTTPETKKPETVNYSTTELASLPANKYIYTATVTGTQYQFMQVVAVASGQAFVFTYTAELSVFNDHLDDVENIISNIVLN